VELVSSKLRELPGLRNLRTSRIRLVIKMTRETAERTSDRRVTNSQTGIVQQDRDNLFLKRGCQGKSCAQEREGGSTSIVGNPRREKSLPPVSSNLRSRNQLTPVSTPQRNLHEVSEEDVSRERKKKEGSSLIKASITPERNKAR